MCTKNHNHMMHASWDMECDRHDFLSFWAIFALWPHNWPQKLKFGKNVNKHLKMCTINEDDHMIWFLRYKSWRTVFWHFGPFFLPFDPTTNLKNQNFEKMKKTPGDIILQKCSKNHDHMVYCSWDMARDRCNFSFSFWAIFLHFTPL